MRRILFVDDDVLVLERIRLHFQPMRDKWAMTFADTGQQAVAELQGHAYDLVVSDINMPGMTGPRLLRTISDRWPQVVRIALSGRVDAQQALQVVPIAHQFLTKSSNLHPLQEVIERCLGLQELLPVPALRALVGRVRGLAPLRSAHGKLAAVLASETATPHLVAKAVREDTVIAAKVLQTVNSSFFAPERRTTNIEQAVTHLGVMAVRDLVTSAEVFAQRPHAPRGVFDLERIQQRRADLPRPGVWVS